MTVGFALRANPRAPFLRARSRYLQQRPSVKSRAACRLERPKVLSDNLGQFYMSVWNLFLSSTVRDLGDYRRAVRDACLHKAQTACLLSEEDWAGGYDKTVDRCVSQVAAANAFVLIVGHWYGSVPRGCDRSITHIEFDNAFRRWENDPDPPMAVMLPEHGSLADKQLRTVAAKIVKKQKIASAAHRQSLTKFVDAVTGSWRRVIRFKHKPDLREHVIARCQEWKGRTPLAAARGEVVVQQASPTSLLSDDQLGALGRETHIGFVRAAIAKLADYPQVPAVAFVAYGDDAAGQRAFLQRLVNTVLKKHYPRRGIATLPVRCDVASLPGWVAQSLALIDGAAVQSPEQLAARVATELKRQPLYFALDRVGDLPGGVSAFRDGFWRPFYDALSALRATQQFTHRLVALVSEYTAPLATWQAATCNHDGKGAQPDYTKLIRIPRLVRFERQDVLDWFEEMDVADDPVGRRAELADRVMKDSKGVPLRAFERLRGETLWPAGD